MIYFDNAATSLPKPQTVKEAVMAAMDTFGGAGRGAHPAALAASRCIFQARAKIAGLFGASLERTVFTSGATESLNIAIAGLLTPGDHVITTALEHNSVLRPLYKLEREGMELSIIPADKKGLLDYAAFPKALQPNTKAIVCTHASNLTGLLLDLDYITAFCQEHDLLLILDASQSGGVFPLDLDRQGIDVLCFAGHKGLMGLQGTGGLCLREGLSIPPFKTGGSGFNSFSKTQPTDLPEALEAGTLNGHGIAGLLAGVTFIEEVGIETIRRHEQQLAEELAEGLRTIPGIKIYREPGHEYGGVVAVNIGEVDSQAVGTILSEDYDIYVRSGAHCAPLAHEALGTKEQGAVRFSFSYFNRSAEIEVAIAAMKEIAEKVGDHHE